MFSSPLILTFPSISQKQSYDQRRIKIVRTGIQRETIYIIFDSQTKILKFKIEALGAIRQSVYNPFKKTDACCSPWQHPVASQHPGTILTIPMSSSSYPRQRNYNILTVDCTLTTAHSTKDPSI